MVWCLEDNLPAVDFYRGRGGRDIAEGTEVFDGQPVRKLAFVWK